MQTFVNLRIIIIIYYDFITKFYIQPSICFIGVVPAQYGVNHGSA